MVTLGCTDPTACNYNEDANLEDGSCKYGNVFMDCDGNCINDTDQDEICDEEDNCVEVVNPVQTDSDNDGEGDACDYDDGIGIEEISENMPILIKMIDVLGREQQEHKIGSILFYIYDNGKIGETNNTLDFHSLNFLRSFQKGSNESLQGVPNRSSYFLK